MDLERYNQTLAEVVTALAILHDRFSEPSMRSDSISDRSMEFAIEHIRLDLDRLVEFSAIYYK